MIEYAIHTCTHMPQHASHFAVPYTQMYMHVMFDHLSTYRLLGSMQVEIDVVMFARLRVLV